MEEHRLTEMPENYDPEVFNRIYRDTEKYRSKLASQVDPRRFGVSNADIKSYFNTKFLFTFTKYYDDFDEQKLKAYIINSLGMFKNRLLRKAYSKSVVALANKVDIDEVFDVGEIPDVLPISQEEDDLDKVKNYMRSKLSLEAYNIFLAKYDPPEFIIQRLENNPKKLNRIPKELLAEFFDYPVERVAKHLKKIRDTIRDASKDLN